MRLTDLEPRWVRKGEVFVFRCPSCRKIWISCKAIELSIHDQIKLFRRHKLDPCGPHYAVVPMREDCRWKITGTDFDRLTVSPSIHAGAAGHWHGFITDGAIIDAPGGDCARR